MPLPALLPLLPTRPSPRHPAAAAPVRGIGPSPAIGRHRDPADDSNLLGALGGERGIRAIVDALIVTVAADPRINHAFASANPARLRRLLVAQFTVLSLGPVRDDDPVPDLDLAYAHRSLALDGAGFRALIEDLEEVLDHHRLPLSQQGRLLSRFATAFARPRLASRHRHLA